MARGGFEDENVNVVLDDQPRQYWIYANTDNELATVHIKVDCESLVTRARSNTWSSMLLPLPLDDDNQIYIRTCFIVERQSRISQNSIVQLSLA